MDIEPAAKPLVPLLRAPKRHRAGRRALGPASADAFTVEQIVVQHVHEQLQSPAGVLSQLPDWMLAHPEYDEQAFTSALTTIAEVWELLFPHFRERIVKQVLERVTVHPNEISVRLRVDGFVALVRAHLEGETLQLTIREMLSKPPPKKSPKTTR